VISNASVNLASRGLAPALIEASILAISSLDKRVHFERVIQSKERPEEIPEIKPSAYDILTVLVEAGVVKSKSDAKRDIEGGGVRVNEDPIIDFKTEVKPGDVIQKGKRFFVKVL
jgi:tyrosyl-tRNA synthetase